MKIITSVPIIKLFLYFGEFVSRARGQKSLFLMPKPAGKSAGAATKLVRKAAKKIRIKKRKGTIKKSAVRKSAPRDKSEEQRGNDGLTSWERAADAAMQGHVDPETRRRDRVRALLTEALAEVFAARRGAGDGGCEGDDGGETSAETASGRKVLEIEEALFALHGAQHGGNGITQEYLEKAKSLKFNLKTNKELRDALLHPSRTYDGKTLTVDALLAMSSADLARSEKKEERKVNQTEDIFHRNLSKLDHLPQSKRELQRLPASTPRAD
jgi:hypothetical protein